MDYKDIVKKGYDQIAHQYLAARHTNSPDVKLLGDFMELLAPQASVLDAGCGAGIPVTTLLAERFNVTGVDISETQVALAKQNVPHATFLCADLTRLHFPVGTFDGICSYYAIIHIPRDEHRALLTKFHRMLKSSGVALLCLGAENLVDDLDDNYFGTTMYWSHFDTETYDAMLKEIGFRLIWSKFIGDASCEGAEHQFVLAQKR